jgi:DNA-binding response OmpR family regulator
LKSGADDYVSKPYEIREFTLKLEILLKRTKKHKEVIPIVKKAGVFGSLKEFSLPDLLQILEYSLKTALVTVMNGNKEGSIYMEEG